MTYVDEDDRRALRHRPQAAEHPAGLAGQAPPVDAVMDDIGGVVTRVGDETVGEMWSLYDGQDVLNEVDPRFSENIARHITAAPIRIPFHVSANTDPKGDRSKRPQDQDPDILLHVVRETDNGIVVRGAKYETAAAYANQAFVKPTIANWGDSELSDYALGFIVQMGAPGLRHICRTGFAGRAPIADYPLANRVDEVDTLVIFDDVEIPWEDILFYRHTRAASIHPRHAPPLLRVRLRAAHPAGRRPDDRRRPLQREQTGLEKPAGRAGEAGRAGLLPRGHQRPPDGGDRHGRDVARRPADAEPVAAVLRPRVRLLAAARR